MRRRAGGEIVGPASASPGPGELRKEHPGRVGDHRRAQLLGHPDDRGREEVDPFPVTVGVARGQRDREPEA